jgi:hypothetical protein
MEMQIDALINNLGNPARSFVWEMIMPNPLGGDTETLMLRCQVASLPGRSFSPIAVPFRQTAGFKVPGKIVYSHLLNLTFIEGEDRAIFDAMYTWFNRVINDKTGRGESGLYNYKKDFYLHANNTDGSLGLSIRVKGSFPENMPDVGLGNDDTVINYMVGFSYDSWEQEGGIYASAFAGLLSNMLG